LIYIGIGSNLNGKNNETPLQNCKKALVELKKEVNICKISSWYKSEPIPVSNQPWFINGVIEISTDKSSLDLLEFILSIEKVFGRVREKKNEARILDLDIIDYKKKILYIKNKLIIPHPRMHERSFVLQPLSELNPKWMHPIKKKGIKELIRNLNDKQKISKISKK
jgi:2-amino-4-hydroxy-6-hydroxymethyldihydropteridine diphosphokinase